MTLDLRDPNCDPKVAFDEFVKYLSEHTTNMKDGMFYYGNLLFMIEEDIVDSELADTSLSGEMARTAAEFFESRKITDMLLSCWEQCGYIRPSNGASGNTYAWWINS